MSKTICIGKTEQLCYQYIAAVEQGNLEALLALFTPNASVYSPIFGECSVKSFYSYIFRSISNRTMVLRNILYGGVKTNQVAIYLSYTRSVEGRDPATIDVVDLFDFTDDFSAFSSVKIIYDTAPIHGDFVHPKNMPR
ncbi:nuclear transport factor 2 family protein [Microbulbifer sp. CnH-101-G]|uniref:nuclear transport factor 2 family protein n=1 Tax=Microbulbifer sp. CnH-101-G TaxID=3243393 RepID=UPI00403A429A